MQVFKVLVSFVFYALLMGLSSSDSQASGPILSGDGIQEWAINTRSIAHKSLTDSAG